MKSFSLILIFAFLAGCKTTGSPQNGLLPMYGKTTPLSTTELSQEHKNFIEEATVQFGSKPIASNSFLDKGFNFYNKSQLNKAMKSFNKAWLLNPENPGVYHGLGSVIYAQGHNCRAMETMNKALELDWGKREYNRPGFLADLGMITSLCAYTTGYKQYGNQESLIKDSDNLFLEAESLHKSPYLYDKWWQSLYWRGDYSGAWKKVFKMQELGEEPNPVFLEQLKKKLAKPQP